VIISISVSSIVSNQNQQCTSLGRWNVQFRQKKRAKHWFQRSSVVQVSIFDHTSDEIVFIELNLEVYAGVCVLVSETGQSQIHKNGDDVKKCYYWRLSPGVARHLNVIEKESQPSFWLKKGLMWAKTRKSRLFQQFCCSTW